jgi:hypothetical protein
MLLGSFVPQMDAEDNHYEMFASPPESSSSPMDSQVMRPQVEITMTSDSIGETPPGYRVWSSGRTGVAAAPTDPRKRQYV